MMGTKWFLTPVLCLGLSLSSRHEARAQGVDQKAQDAFGIFTSFCIATFGDRKKALSMIGNGNAVAARIPDDVLLRSFNGRTGGVGWAINAPRGARMLLEYDPLGVCMVQVAEANAQDLMGIFTAAIERGSNPGGGRLSRQPDKSWEQSGVGLTTRRWTIQFETEGTYDAVITTAQRPLGKLQHIMTFSREGAAAPS